MRARRWFGGGRHGNRPGVWQRTAIAAGACALLLATPARARSAAGSPAAAGRRGGAPASVLPPGTITHIFVIEMENEGYEATFGPSSPATYLTHTLARKGEILANYYAIGHVSLDNYIAQVSGQAPTRETQADCLGTNAAFVDVAPGTPAPDQATDPGQVVGQGCVYPPSVQTIAKASRHD